MSASEVISVIGKVVKLGFKIIPILRRLTYVFLCVYLTSLVFDVSDSVDHILSYLDVKLISSVATLCLGTGAFVVVGVVALYVVAEGIGAGTGHLAEMSTGTGKRRFWRRFSLVATLLVIYLELLIELAAYVVFLASSVLLVLGEDCVATPCALIPGERCWQGIVYLVNVFVLLFLEGSHLHDLLKRDEETRPPLGA